MNHHQIPVFEVALSDSPEAGIQAVSFVLNPAIGAPFVALTQEPQPARLHLSADMKQVVTGPALIPDLPILRLSGDNTPYFIRFSAATIEAISRRFMASANLSQTTHEHQIALQGNAVVESWLISDPAKDKSAALGLTGLPTGTWLLSVHISDAEYWQREILSGNLRGFSIEAMLDLADPATALLKAEPQTPAQPTNVSKLTPQTRKRNLFQRLMAAVFLSIEKVVDGPEIEIDDQTGTVYQIDADGKRGEVLPDGNYTLESGDQLIVVNGQQSSPADAASSAEAPAPVEAAAVEAPVEAPDYAAQFDELRAEIETLKALLQQNEAARTSLMATNTELQTKLAAEPAAKPVKLTAIPVEDKAKRTYERYAEAALRVR